MTAKICPLEKDPSVAYPTKRAALKARIIKEVMDDIFPEEEEIDVTEYVGVQGPDVKGSCFVELLKFLGCLPVSVHQAVMNGSPKQLTNALQLLAEGENPDPSRVNMRDVILIFQIRLNLSSNVIYAFDVVPAAQDSGRTALSIAVKTRRSELIEILLEFNANPNLVDLDTGMSPLMFAVSTSNVGAADMLLKNGADVAHVDYQGVTPLMLASSIGDWDCTHLLLKHNANVDAVDLNGWTPLHHAAFGGNPDVCELLIEEGANRKIKNNQNRKALHIARSKGFGNVIAVLEDKKSVLYVEEYDA